MRRICVLSLVGTLIFTFSCSRSPSQKDEEIKKLRSRVEELSKQLEEYKRTEGREPGTSLVSKETLEEAQAASVTSGRIYFATGTVNVREGPGTNFSIIAKLNLGDEVRSLQREAKWDKVKLKDGRVGYVFNQLLTDKDIVVSIVKTGWDMKMASGMASYAHFPQILFSVTNMRSEPIEKLTMKGVFYKGKEIWGEDEAYVVSSFTGDIPLKKGYTKKDFLTSPQGLSFPYGLLSPPSVKVELYLKVGRGDYQLYRTVFIAKKQW